MLNRNYRILHRNPFACSVFTLVLCCLCLPGAALGQDEDDGPKPEKLFSSESTAKVSMSAPWRDIVRNTKNQNPYPASITFTDSLGNTMTLNMTVERRGITRQRVCKYPPIKLRFRKEDVKGTMFRGQKSLKLVTHCQKSSRFEQYYILEMLAYQMYNQINDYSFRVRALDVDYVDSKTGDVDDSRFGFLIEDDSDVAKRNGLKKLNVPRVRLTQLEPVITSEMSLFQYMIANVDWAATSGPAGPNECCHNAKLIGPEPLKKTDAVYPIPYDFDSSGLVDAHYAVPPDGLRMRSVTQRVFRGYCAHNGTLESARQKFLEKEDAVLGLIRDESRLTNNTRKRSLKYIRQFYEIIQNPRDFENRVIEKCRK